MHTMSRQNNTTIQVMKETESEQTVPPTQPSSKDETGHNISSQDPTAPIGESPNSSEVKQVTETVYDTSSPNPKPSFTKVRAAVLCADLQSGASGWIDSDDFQYLVRYGIIFFLLSHRPVSKMVHRVQIEKVVLKVYLHSLAS